MSDLVWMHHNEPMTTSEAIAEGTGVQHKNVLELVRKFTSELLELGEVAFQTRLNPQGSPTEVVFLNEPQATLLLTFMRNSEIVVRFKVALVKAFFAMRDQLRSGQGGPAVLSTDPAHVADLTVSASRTFNALLRTSRAAGLSLPKALRQANAGTLPKALRQANAGTLRKTGVDMLKEIEAENHVAGLEAEHSAPPRAPIEIPEDPIEIAVVQWAQHVEPGTYYRMEQIIRETIGMEPKDRRWASMTVYVGRVLKRIGFSVKNRWLGERVHRYWERKA